MEQKRRVYIVFRETMTEYQFCDVFFTEEAAKNYISNKCQVIE